MLLVGVLSMVLVYDLFVLGVLVVIGFLDGNVRCQLLSSMMQSRLEFRFFW